MENRFALFRKNLLIMPCKTMIKAIRNVYQISWSPADKPICRAWWESSVRNWLFGVP
jgi:hypothetical protein